MKYEKQKKILKVKKYQEIVKNNIKIQDDERFANGKLITRQ